MKIIANLKEQNNKLEKKIEDININEKVKIMIQETSQSCNSENNEMANEYEEMKNELALKEKECSKLVF